MRPGWTRDGGSRRHSRSCPRSGGVSASVPSAEWLERVPRRWTSPLAQVAPRAAWREESEQEAEHPQASLLGRISRRDITVSVGPALRSESEAADDSYCRPTSQPVEWP